MSVRRGVIAGFGLVLASSGCLHVPPPLPAEAGARPSATAVPGPRSPGQVYRPGEVRVFELRQAGRPFGRSWGRYLGEAGGRHVFETRLELDLPGRPAARTQGRLVVDGRGFVVEGSERSDAAELSFVREGDLLRFRSDRAVDEVAYEPERTPTAVMAHSAILHEELMLALLGLDRPTLSVRLVPLSGGAPVQWQAEVQKPDAEGEVVLTTSLGETVRLRDGRIVRVEVEADGLAIAPIEPPPAWPSWNVAGPRKLVYAPPSGASFEIREVELPGRSGEPPLAGEVLVPAGPGKRAGVVFLSGTGRQDRHGFAGPPPVDLGSHEITDALAQAGLVVLRYDEPGHGKSAVGPSTFVAQISEAERAFATLMVQPEVDPDRILVVGHGEGGWRALRLAQKFPREIRGVALLATPGRRYEEILRDQGERNLARLPAEVRAEARKQQDQMIRALKEGDAPPPELADQAEWIRQVMEIDPVSLLRGARCPLWLAQGGKDFESHPEHDVAAWRRHARASQRTLDVARFPELDHLFKHEPGTSEPGRYLEDRRVDPGFLRELVEWATARTRDKRSPSLDARP